MNIKCAITLIFMIPHVFISKHTLEYKKLECLGLDFIFPGKCLIITTMPKHID